MRLNYDSGYTTSMWVDHGKWQSVPMDSLLGFDKEKKLWLPVPLADKNAKEETIDAPFVVVAKGDNPETSPAVGLYTPSKSEINTHQILGLDKKTGKAVYREDRRDKSFLVVSHVTPAQSAVLSRFFLTGMPAPGHGKPGVVEALQNETYVLFGTPDRIRKCVATLEAKLR